MALHLLVLAPWLCHGCIACSCSSGSASWQLEFSTHPSCSFVSRFCLAVHHVEEPFVSCMGSAWTQSYCSCVREDWAVFHCLTNYFILGIPASEPLSNFEWLGKWIHCIKLQTLYSNHHNKVELLVENCSSVAQLHDCVVSFPAWWRTTEDRETSLYT